MVSADVEHHVYFGSLFQLCHAVQQTTLPAGHRVPDTTSHVRGAHYARLQTARLTRSDKAGKSDRYVMINNNCNLVFDAATPLVFNGNKTTPP